MWRAEWMAKRMTRRFGIPIDESMAVAENALLIAIRVFDPTRAKLSTLFFRAVWSESQRRARWNRPLGYRVCDDRPPKVCGAGLMYGMAIAAPEPVTPPEEWADLPAVLAAVGKLEPRRREIIESRLLRDETLQSIADRLGITKERVRQLYADAIDLVRQSLKIEAIAC